MFDYIYDDSLIDFEENKCEFCLLKKLCENSGTIVDSSFCQDEREEFESIYSETSWSEFKSNHFYKKTNRFSQNNFELDDWQKYLSEG